MENIIKKSESLKGKLNHYESFLKKYNFSNATFEYSGQKFNIAVPNSLKDKFQIKDNSDILKQILVFHFYFLRKAENDPENLSNLIKKGDCSIISGLTKKFLKSKGRRVERLLGESNRKLYPMNFYKEFGYDHHYINYVLLSGGIFMAFDMTSHKTFFNSKNKNEIFAILGESEENMLTNLKNLTGDNWKNAHA